MQAFFPELMIGLLAGVACLGAYLYIMREHAKLERMDRERERGSS